MREFRRYAIYYAPRAGAVADATAGWLGWDPVQGEAVAHPAVSGLPAAVADLTAEPRKYGFHGTIKAPFRLADGVDLAMLEVGVADLARHLRPVVMDGLSLRRLGRFLALVPEGDEADLLHLGAEVVSRLEPLRAALSPAELAKRDPARLSQRQRDLLGLWGYPYVMEEFRFHLTLTGPLEDAVAVAVASVLDGWLAPVLPRPFVIEDLCLFGEDGEGRFHLVSRHALAG
jgi:putative phosphonate metabolism protein